MTLELTERCNLRCPHCYIPREKVSEELTTAEILGIIDQLAEAGVIWLSLTGGEACLREDLAEIIGHASQRRFCVSMISNGTLMDRQVRHRLFDLGLSRLAVSLYHVDPVHHDRFVGLEGAWERSVEALRDYKEMSGKAKALILLMSWNGYEVLGLERFCLDNDWQYTIDPSVFPRMDGDRSVLQYQASKEQMLHVFGNSKLYGERLRQKATEKDPEGSICGVGHGSAWMTPNGDLLACKTLPWKLGNLREDSFRDVWLHSPVRKKILSLRWGDAAECASCELARYCVRCPGLSFLETGDVNKPTPMMCRLAEVDRELRSR